MDILSQRNKKFFGGLDMQGGLMSPPPGKYPCGSSMSSNNLVSHQKHRDGQFYDVKWSKILFNCKRDSKIFQKVQFFQNFQMTQKMFLDIVGVITTSKLSILSTFQGGDVSAPPMSSRVKRHRLQFSRCSFKSVQFYR